MERLSFKVPQKNKQIFLSPSGDKIGSLLEENKKIFSQYSFTILNQPFREVREKSRKEVIQRALKFSKKFDSNIEEKRFDSIGPVIGNELKESAIWAIIIALIAIVLYIGWAFRKVSRPVSSFKYGIIATIALFHDIIITLGVFSVLGYLYNVEIGIPFVAALLAILGYSVNDTIVVFDRTRENLIKSGIEEIFVCCGNNKKNYNQIKKPLN